MDFAPYQSESPETSRALSPPARGSLEGRRSFSPPTRRSFSPALPGANTNTPNPWVAPTAGGFGNGGTTNGDAEEGRGGRLNEFETSLPIRMDYEACLAYLLLPPAGGVLLLVLEQKSDYVR